MLHVILYQPEIPPNTGNIIRLCANTGARLHLIEPLGFTLDDKRLRRAGLDYNELTELQVYRDWETFRARNLRIGLWAFTTKANRYYSQATVSDGDGLLFGPETRGLPGNILDGLGVDRLLRLPMRSESRSLNLSNTVAVGLYEALRQLSFRGLS